MGETLCLAIDVDGLRISEQFVVVRIVTDTGIPIASLSTKQRHLDVYDPDARQDRLVVRIPDLPLVPGRYHVDLSVREQGARGLRPGVEVDRVEHAASFEVTPADVFGVGIAPVSSGRFASGVVFMDSYWEIQAGGVVTGATHIDDDAVRLGSLPLA